jgi:transcriptional regulator with XRE-family HTH domain
MALNSVCTGFLKKPPPINPVVEAKKSSTEKELLRSLGRGIREVRRRKGMTQDRLSEIAEVSPKYLSEVERGNSNVSILLLQRIASALGVDMSALLCGCENASEDGKLKRGIWDELQKLKRQELERAERVLRAVRDGEGQDRW